MNDRGRLKLAVLISGRGSNMLAIAHACLEDRIAAEVALVISDRADAAGLGAARALGIPTALIEAAERTRSRERECFEAALSEAIDGCGAELVLLAGFMRILSPQFV